MKKRVILLGPPGAGKGTHAKLLTKAMKLPHISSGDMLRDAVARKTGLGLSAAEYMEAGQLVPNDLVNGIVVERLKSESEGFLLDGYPRTVQQADTLAQAGIGIDAVILLEVSDDCLVDRITGRLSCSACGSVFHKTNLKPQVEGLCDNCQGSLSQRADDNEETVRQRLSAYHAQTSPLIAYYDERGLLSRIDGTTGIEAGFEAIRKALAF